MPNHPYHPDPWPAPAEGWKIVDLSVFGEIAWVMLAVAVLVVVAMLGMGKR